MNRILYISKNIKYNSSLNKFKSNENKKKLIILNNHNKIVVRSFSQKNTNQGSNPNDPFWRNVMILTGIVIISKYPPDTNFPFWKNNIILQYSPNPNDPFWTN